MSVEVSRRSLSLAVDASKADSVSIKGNQLDVEKRLYLGGLPPAHATRRLNVGRRCRRGNRLLWQQLMLACASGQQQLPGLRARRPSERRHVGSVQTRLAAQRHFLFHQRPGGRLLQRQRLRRLQ